MSRQLNSMAVSLALLSLVLAGCSSSTKPSTPAGTTPKLAADGAPAAAPDGGPQLVPPTKNEPQSSTAPLKAIGRVHTVAFRADTTTSKLPKVALTRQEQDQCKVKVGDSMPGIELPSEAGKTTKLADLYGKAATVVVFWKGDRRMTREQLADIGPDVVEPFGKAGVAVVGVAVQESAGGTREALTKAGAKFDNLLDADGKAFAQVGSERLPRTYVLDASGKIVWFDIEYSLTTRRELHDVLTVLTSGK